MGSGLRFRAFLCRFCYMGYFVNTRLFLFGIAKSFFLYYELKFNPAGFSRFFHPVLVLVVFLFSLANP